MSEINAKAAQAGDRTGGRGVGLSGKGRRRFQVLGLSIAALLLAALGSASANAASGLHRSRSRKAEPPITQHAVGSLVVFSESDQSGSRSTARVGMTEKDWLDRHAGRVSGRQQELRCDLCARSAVAAATALPGEPAISPQIDMDSLTRRLTTLQIADSTVRVTSVSPLGLLFRKPF